MDAITESMLAELIANGAVGGITIRAVPGGYETIVTMIWDESKQARVVTYRTREPKVWASLDRLVAFLTQLNPPPIKLDMVSGKHAAKKRKRRASS